MIETTSRVQEARADFPILETLVNGRPLVYLDNAATSQKPRQVLRKLHEYWETSNANVHRGVHHLSQMATAEFDQAREMVRILLNAKSCHEVILTKGCTEGINLVANCLTSGSGATGSHGTSTPKLKSGDQILLSNLEHHSNIVPWQIAAERVGAEIKVVPISDSAEIDLDAYKHLLKSGRVKVVGIVHVSNSLGTINPVAEMVRLAHDAGSLVLVDGAQAGPHVRIDVQALDADFYTLSCHKIYAPTGVGVLYGKERLLDAMPPYQGGGDMIRTVDFDRSTYADLPMKFEPGTPNIAGVIGLGAAIEYLMGLGGHPDENTALDRAFAAISKQETELRDYATAKLEEVPGFRMVGNAREKAAIVSFTLDSAHPHDIGTILNSEGIAIRAGHHCCMPAMKRMGVPATARASFSFYNTLHEVDALVESVKKVTEIFS